MIPPKDPLTIKPVKVRKMILSVNKKMVPSNNTTGKDCFYAPPEFAELDQEMNQQQGSVVQQSLLSKPLFSTLSALKSSNNAGPGMDKSRPHFRSTVSAMPQLGPSRSPRFPRPPDAKY